MKTYLAIVFLLVVPVISHAQKNGMFEPKKQKADSCVKYGDYETAIKYYKECSKVAGKQTDFILGRIHDVEELQTTLQAADTSFSEQKDYKDAYNKYKELMKKSPYSEHIKKQKEASFRLLHPQRDGSPKTPVVTLLPDSITFDTKNIEILMQKADSCVRYGNYDMASEYYEKCKEAGNGNIEIWGHITNSIKEFDELLSTLQAANTLFERGSYKSSLPMYQDVLKKSPHSTYLLDRIQQCEEQDSEAPNPEFDIPDRKVQNKALYFIPFGGLQIGKIINGEIKDDKRYWGTYIGAATGIGAGYCLVNWIRYSSYIHSSDFQYIKNQRHFKDRRDAYMWGTIGCLALNGLFNWLHYQHDVKRKNNSVETNLRIEPVVGQYGGVSLSYNF